MSANIYIVIDRSGSMVSMWQQAVDGVNGYVKEIANTAPDAVITVVAFDSDKPYDKIRTNVRAGKFKAIYKEEISPRGSTPLFDAAGNALAEAESDGAERTTVVIMTDGHENASKEFTREGIKARVARAMEKGWDVIFLGADFDVTQYSNDFGIAKGDNLTFSAHNFGEAFAATAMRSASYAATGMKSTYSDEFKSKMEK
jgi:Mg-chelatase subunit ChlD